MATKTTTEAETVVSVACSACSSGWTVTVDPGEQFSTQFCRCGAEASVRGRFGSLPLRPRV